MEDTAMPEAEDRGHDIVAAFQPGEKQAALPGLHFRHTVKVSRDVGMIEKARLLSFPAPGDFVFHETVNDRRGERPSLMDLEMKWPFFFETPGAATEISPHISGQGSQPFRSAPPVEPERKRFADIALSGKFRERRVTPGFRVDVANIGEIESGAVSSGLPKGDRLRRFFADQVAVVEGIVAGSLQDPQAQAARHYERENRRQGFVFSGPPPRGVSGCRWFFRSSSTT